MKRKKSKSIPLTLPHVLVFKMNTLSAVMVIIPLKFYKVMRLCQIRYLEGSNIDSNSADTNTGHITETNSNNNSGPRRVIKKPTYLQEFV